MENTNTPLRPCLSLICLPMTKIFDSCTGCINSTALRDSAPLSAPCEACACATSKHKLRLMCVRLKVSISLYFLVCACYVCVCVRLSVANYPSYKYKIPIRHWVSGWLQRRHNWFQMVTQIFLSVLQRRHTACVWEKAAGESEAERRGKKKDEWQEWINTERAQE